MSLGAAARQLINFNAARRTPRSIFRYRCTRCRTRSAGRIGTSTLFAAWNAAIYVAQIEDVQALRSRPRWPLSRGYDPRSESNMAGCGSDRRNLCDLAPSRAGMIGEVACDRTRPGFITRSCCAVVIRLREVSSGGHQTRRVAGQVLVQAFDVTIHSSPAGQLSPQKHRDCSRIAPRRVHPVAAHCRGAKCRRARRSMIFLAPARGEAPSRRIVLIAGDVAAAKGPFRSTLDVCAAV